jgi:hypothetical protein
MKRIELAEQHSLGQQVKDTWKLYYFFAAVDGSTYPAKITTGETQFPGLVQGAITRSLDT